MRQRIETVAMLQGVVVWEPGFPNYQRSARARVEPPTC